MLDYSVKFPRYGLGATGICIGLVCLSYILVTGFLGTEGYTARTTVTVQEGELAYETHRRLFPYLMRVAFYVIFISLLFSTASFLRNEQREASWGALIIGLSPVLMYFAGWLVAYLIALIASYPCLKLIVVFRLRKHNNQFNKGLG